MSKKTTSKKNWPGMLRWLYLTSTVTNRTISQANKFRPTLAGRHAYKIVVVLNHPVGKTMLRLRDPKIHEDLRWDTILSTTARFQTLRTNITNRLEIASRECPKSSLCRHTERLIPKAKTFCFFAKECIADTRKTPKHLYSKNQSSRWNQYN